MKKFSSTVKGSSHRIYQTRRSLYIVGAGILLVFLMILLPRLFAFVSSIVLTPLVAVENWLMESNSTFPAYLRDRNELLKNIEDLEKQLIYEQDVDGAEELLRRENEELRQLLGDKEEERIGAAVIGRPSALPYDVIVLDKGTDDGVLINAPVYVSKDQVIGFVAATFAQTSVVTLATTPGFSSTVYIYGPDIYTTAEGMGAGTLRVNVPQGIELAEGNVVVLPSFSSGVYGTISVVESVPTKPEQYGYVSTDIPLSSLRFVSVGKRPLENIDFEEARNVIDAARFEILSVPVPSGVLVDSNFSTSSTSTVGSSTETLLESDI